MSVSVSKVCESILRAHTDANRFVIAYSGGLDSHVLLHVMSEIKKNHPAMILQAVHVNHQLNSAAEQWAMHCKKTAESLHISLMIETISIDFQKGDSLEENAREARYAVLQKHLENAVLLTAHHANDQAETFLLQALRGAGPKGLSAMPVKKKLGESVMIRPLLSFSRASLEQYATDNQLQWIEDDSNQDPRFRRNYLRHTVMPLLENTWPSVAENFSRSARLLAEHESLIEDIAREDFLRVVENASDVSVLNLKKLLLLSDMRQRLVLRVWFAENHLRMPNAKHIKQIQQDVLRAGMDAHPVFVLGKTRIVRKRGLLFIV